MNQNARKYFLLYGTSGKLFGANGAAAARSFLVSRGFSIVPIFARLLRLRYLFLGTAVGSGIAINNVNYLKN